MAQPPNATHTAEDIAALHNKAPTPLEKLAKAAGGDKTKLLEVLATQQRWDWHDVAVLLTGSYAAVAEFVKAQEEATQKRMAEATAAAEKWREAADRALVEGHETAHRNTATTATQHR